MKHCLSLFGLILLTQFITAQNYYSDIDYETIKHVDQRTKKLVTPSYNVKLIAKRITKPYDTDLEKVRAIFVWMTHNIAYDCKKLKKRPKRKKISYHTKVEYEEKQERLFSREITTALRKRKGICEDYARMFTKMCKISGIEAGYIPGKTKTKVHQVGKKPCGRGHAWNWARINGQVYLFDVTWGSGYTDDKCNQFHFSFADEYFMIPPEKMILTHYPDETKYQFLEQPLNKEQFGFPPLYKDGYKKLTVIDFQPFIGSIKESQKEVVFKIKIKEAIDHITLNDEKNNFIFSKEKDYFILKYTIPEHPKREINIRAYSENGEAYHLFTYQIKRGI